LDARLAGRVGGDFDVTLNGGAEPVVYAVGDLQGHIRGRRVLAQLRGSWSERVLEIERGRLLLDDGSLELAGRLTPGLADLRFAADVPRIETWHPAARGVLVASGTVRGERDNPAITIRIDSRNLALDAAPIPPRDEPGVTVDGFLAAHTVRV